MANNFWVVQVHDPNYLIRDGHRLKDEIVVKVFGTKAESEEWMDNLPETVEIQGVWDL